MKIRTATFKEVFPKYSLRAYQKKAVNQILQSLQKHRYALLHAPTGAGKTRMAMAAISMHFRKKGPTMVLWLAPTRELVVQAAQDFETAWNHHGDVPATVIQWRGGGERFSHGTTIKRNTLLVASLQMAVDKVNVNAWIKKSLHDRVDLVVFDEAHQSIAPTYRELVNEVVTAKGQSRSLLGLSATPGRFLIEESKELVAMYGGNKVGIGDGENPVQFLQQKGYLAKPVFTTHGFPGLLEPKNPTESDYSRDEMDALGGVAERNEKIKDVVLKLFNDGHRRVICFTPSIESTENCAEMVSQAGVAYSWAISGDTNKNDRDHIVRTFCRPISDMPSQQVIFNCNVLTTGFDAPEISATVICRPTKSAILLQQMIGRALRGPESGGTKEAQIHMLVDDSFKDFSNLVDLFSKWDQLWDSETD